MMEHSKDSFIDTVIVNNFKDAQTYFPRLSKFLMANLCGDTTDPTPLKPCQIVAYYTYKVILYYLCAVCEVKDEYIDAFEYFTDKLTPEVYENKNYLDFEDGYVYDFNFKKAYFDDLIFESSINFDMFFAEEYDNKPENYKLVRDTTIKILNHIIKECNINSKMNSNEYLEICYMQSLLIFLSKRKQIEENLNTNPI